MTVQEAKVILEALFSNATGENYPYSDKFGQAMNIALESMEKVEQYRALGTVEELKEAMEKQIPKKPIVKAEKEVPTTHNLGRLLEICCPVCGKRIFAIYETDLERGGGVTREAKGCSRCLQARMEYRWNISAY